jgi:hypothetical protein
MSRNVCSGLRRSRCMTNKLTPRSIIVIESIALLRWEA